MRGYLLTKKSPGRWSSLTQTLQLQALATNMSVGILAGLFMAHFRLGLGMPGHKAMFWLMPVIAARLLKPHTIGAASGACTAAVTSMALGGNLAGGFLFIPLVALAGGLIDVVILWSSHLKLSPWSLIPLLGVGGLAANLICAIKRILVPQLNHHQLLGLSGVTAQIMSYAIFGLLAGLVGATLAVLATHTTRKRKINSPGK